MGVIFAGFSIADFAGAKILKDECRLELSSNSLYFSEVAVIIIELICFHRDSVLDGVRQQQHCCVVLSPGHQLGLCKL